MARIHLLLEGQTEEVIVDSVLGPHLRARGWEVTFSILTTKRVAGQSSFKGGVGNWNKISRELRLLLPSRFDVLTTLIDYYGCPSDTPGMVNRPAGSAQDRVEHVERAMAAAIGHSCFLPNLVLHETESWVLAAVAALGAALGDPDGAAALGRVVEDCGGAELVNDGPATAPSKRLITQWPRYQKTLDGPLALAELGLPALRERCPRLDAWLTRIEQWPTR